MTEVPIQAAGGLVWRRHPTTGEIEVCLVHRPRYDDWTLPKGKLHPGETHIGAAEREVGEETGLRVQIGPPLGRTTYAKSDGVGIRLKEVRYWAMEAIGGAFAPSHEVDEIAWLEPVEAAARVTYEHDRQVLGRFAQET